MDIVRRASEALARKTSRRGLFGKGAGVATGALLGVAAGTLTRPGAVSAGSTSCSFPGPPCPCAGCTSTGPCGKPCVMNTTWYASGCWVSFTGATCCDCDCHGLQGIGVCGCSTDYHHANCP
ncbi:MAG: hypothetical protein WBD55_11995 [Dehalococcoidia bacterium]